MAPCERAAGTGWSAMTIAERWRVSARLTISPLVAVVLALLLLGRWSVLGFLQ